MAKMFKSITTELKKALCPEHDLFFRHWQKGRLYLFHIEFRDYKVYKIHAEQRMQSCRCGDEHIAVKYEKSECNISYKNEQNSLFE